jgi:DNA mismatch endonuclease (patch repair protein)
MVKKTDTRTEEEKRSYTMSRIRGKATTIEVLLQKALWRRGIRYRKNYKKAPGSPDIAIVRYKIAVFCDGEFWHGKDWEEKKYRLKNNREYWVNKIEGNMARDKRLTKELLEQGWHVLRFWESDIKSDLEACVDTVVALVRELKGEGERDCGRYDFAYHGEAPMAAEEAEDEYLP